MDVEIGPHTVVGPEVRIGDRTRVGPQVVIEGVTTLGADNVIVGQASLGGPPQDLSYKGEQFVTINRGTIKGGGVTRIGDHCLLMACSHVAHDCDIQDGVIMGNNVLLAGHVLVEKSANISGAAAANHFVTIGTHAYVGGQTRMVQDVPPYMIVEGHTARVRGVNLIGLQRGGHSDEDIETVRALFRRIFRSDEPRRRVLEDMKTEAPSNDLVKHLVESMERTELGMKGRYRESLREEFTRLGVQRILEGGI